MLQWNLARNVIVIPKTSSLERLTENFNCTDFRLSKAEIEKINGLDCGRRVIDPLKIEAGVSRLVSVNMEEAVEMAIAS